MFVYVPSLLGPDRSIEINKDGLRDSINRALKAYDFLRVNIGKLMVRNEFVTEIGKQSDR